MKNSEKISEKTAAELREVIQRNTGEFVEKRKKRSSEHRHNRGDAGQDKGRDQPTRGRILQRDDKRHPRKRAGT
ncbi:MAG: hypothetical protein LBQ30_10310 [Treponema sp.]|nr:hypothetical protein [Treponema sp.]